MILKMKSIEIFRSYRKFLQLPANPNVGNVWRRMGILLFLCWTKIFVQQGKQFLSTRAKRYSSTLFMRNGNMSIHLRVEDIPGNGRNVKKVMEISIDRKGFYP